jgi:hypothetical protein
MSYSGMTQSAEKCDISTSSIEEGLDFACNLISAAIAKEGEAKPEKGQQLLNELTNYISLRYVGELVLALEYLVGLGNLCNEDNFRSSQFWSQIRWVADDMGLSSEEKQRLEIQNG